MQSLILTLHIIVCVLLVILILLQSGKEGMGVIFGGGNTSVFGSSGAGGILAKLTTFMAIIFVITSLGYTYVSSSRPTAESVILNVQIEKPAAEAKQTVPAKDEAAKPAEQAKPEEVKPAAKQEVKPETKPEVKPDAKADTPAPNVAPEQAPAKRGK